MKIQKRVAAIHDISCIGKCSLTVALPIISAAGIETSVIPTAVLSTHTGGFTGYTFKDLTDEINPIVAHWKTLGIKFDAIYTGYLGSFQQLELISNIFAELKSRETMIIVDPVMADNGLLYASFPDNFPKGMSALAAKADVVIPNITEACLMLGEEYVAEGYSQQYIQRLLTGMADLGAKKVVLTGVEYEKGKLGASTFDKKTGETGYLCSEKIEGYYHGTGDIFGSALVSALLNGFSLNDSVQISINLTVNSIALTKEAGTDRKYGVNFEQSLPKFMKELRLY